MAGFVLRGDICHSVSEKRIQAVKDGFLVCEDGLSQGVFRELPERFAGLRRLDFTGELIIPGLTDLHTHASQYAIASEGLDMELIDWLNACTFPEESRFSDMGYARAVYGAFASELRRGATTRACVFATVHPRATLELMRVLDSTGLVTMAGKVSMDRNSPAALTERGPERALKNAAEWLERASDFKNTYPILTPRFIPACSDALMRGLAGLRERYDLPVQSHLSENRAEVEWVRRLCPESRSYGGAYLSRGMFGGDVRTVMAHCVWCTEEEADLLAARGVFIAHCPQSNVNLSSGIAPARAFIARGARMGLGTDVGAGCHLSVFRAMTDAVQASKLYNLYVDGARPPLTFAEAFYLGTAGGGRFFGKVGSFEPGYEFDAVVINYGAPRPNNTPSVPSINSPGDAPLVPFASSPDEPGIIKRLTKAAYLSDDRHIRAKFVRGVRLF